MTYLVNTPMVPMENHIEYNLINSNHQYSKNEYSIEGHQSDEEYFKQDKWLSVYVARKVGKADISDLTVEDFRTIESLVLPNKGIKYIPDEIGYMTNLKKLDLSGNEIKKIPQTIQYLFNIEEIDLSRNKIISFPSQMPLLSQNAVNLRKINMTDNMLMFDLDNINAIRAGVVLEISQNPMNNVYASKQLILNNKLNLEYKEGENISILNEKIRAQVRLYNTLTGSIERLPDELEINILFSEGDVVKEGLFAKSGKYNINVSIKNASLINGNENTAIVLSGIPIEIKGNSSTESVNYNEKLIRVSKIKAQLRQEPLSSSPVISELEYGKEIKAIGESGDFYKVQYDTYIGFLSKKEVEEVKYSLKEVSSNKANVYILKTVDSPIFATVPKRQLVKVYSTDGEWSIVSYGGKIMYMKSSDLVNTVTYIGEIIVDKAKVRETPSDKSNAIGMMSRGDKVEIYEAMNNGWYKIKYLNKTGYLRASELKINTEIKIPGDNQNFGNSNIVQNPSSTVKPETGDNLDLEIMVAGVSILGIIGLNKKKEKFVEKE